MGHASYARTRASVWGIYCLRVGRKLDRHSPSPNLHKIAGNNTLNGVIDSLTTGTLFSHRLALKHGVGFWLLDRNCVSCESEGINYPDSWFNVVGSNHITWPFSFSSCLKSFASWRYLALLSTSKWLIHGLIYQKWPIQFSGHFRGEQCFSLDHSFTKFEKNQHQLGALVLLFWVQLGQALRLDLIDVLQAPREPDVARSIYYPPITLYLSSLKLRKCLLPPVCGCQQHFPQIEKTQSCESLI
jgi:hypothetical protein